MESHIPVPGSASQALTQKHVIFLSHHFVRQECSTPLRVSAKHQNRNLIYSCAALMCYIDHCENGGVKMDQKCTSGSTLTPHSKYSFSTLSLWSVPGPLTYSHMLSILVDLFPFSPLLFFLCTTCPWSSLPAIEITLLPSCSCRIAFHSI